MNMPMDFEKALKERRLGCLVPGCDGQSALRRQRIWKGKRRAIILGYCQHHLAARKGRTHCLVESCELVCMKRRGGGREYSVGYCREHYRKMCAQIHRPNKSPEPETARPLRKIAADGYARILVGNTYRPEHRVVMEAHLGRQLVKGESVHHINGRRADNCLENLELIVGPIFASVRARELCCPHCGKPYSARA